MDIRDGFWLLWCLNAPWHKWVKRERVGDNVDKVTCSCGRSYIVNYIRESASLIG